MIFGKYFYSETKFFSFNSSRLAGHGESTSQIKRMVGILHQKKIKTDSHVVDKIRADRQEIASFTENIVVSDVIRRTKNKRGDSHLGKTSKIMTNLST